jgi:tRNA nucleotidyltransferase/poly(A) polymerase
MADYNFLMESRLSSEHFRVLNHISRLAAQEGLNLYLVGGAVRDLTYGQTINDLDFVVAGNPEKIIRRLGPARNGRIRPGQLEVGAAARAALEIEYLRFDSDLQAADFTFTNGVRGEIAMARSEIHSRPGRRPVIHPTSIFEDLRRRDFSVDAMAVSLHPNSRGLLLDPTNGGADIESRELRVLHSRSFTEDPSRIYRLLRLGLRLDFKPEARTKQYLDSALENRAWEHMDPEMQATELRATLQEESSARILKMLLDRGLMAGLEPKLARLRIPYECLAKVRAVLRATPGEDPFLLNLYCLVEKLGPSQKARLAKLVIPYQAAAQLASSFDRQAASLDRVLRSSRAASPSQVYALLSQQPRQLLLFVLAHYPQAKTQNRVKNYLFKYPEIRANLPRAELQSLGVPPGPRFDKILDRVFQDQLDGKIKSQQQLMKTLRAYAGIKEPPPVKPAKPKTSKLQKTPKTVKASPSLPAPPGRRLSKQR